MAKKERDAGKRTEMRKAMSLVVTRDEQAMAVIDAERSEFGNTTPEKGFSQDSARGVFMMCTDLEVGSVSSRTSKK